MVFRKNGLKKNPWTISCTILCVCKHFNYSLYDKILSAVFKLLHVHLMLFSREIEAFNQRAESIKLLKLSNLV